MERMALQLTGVLPNEYPLTEQEDAFPDSPASFIQITTSRYSFTPVDLANIFEYTLKLQYMFGPIGGSSANTRDIHATVLLREHRY